MSEWKLYYFDVEGKAEPIRYLLAIGKQPYQDVRFGWETWPSFKPGINHNSISLSVQYNGTSFTK